MKVQTCNYEVNVSLLASWQECNDILDAIDNIQGFAPTTLLNLADELRKAMRGFTANFDWRISGTEKK